MDLSGVIFVVLALVWAAYLLPKALRHHDEVARTRSVDEVTVRTARLDHELGSADLPSPCLLKIDVQGFEMEVLAGAEALLPSVDEILVECSFVELYDGQPLADEVIVFLLGVGYRLRGAYGMSTDDDGRCLQADLLFLRSETPQVT